jgi:dimeric dUTPase (all-alpha-NTP-PPase superfamily)
MQNDLNIFLNPKWKSANYDFRLAASQELSELIDQLPWKWWKASINVDMAQAKLEVVDITHFIIADMLKYFEKPELVARLILDTKMKYDEARVTKAAKKPVSDSETNCYAGPKTDETVNYQELIKKTFQLQARLVNCSVLYLPDVLIELWEVYDLKLEEIAKIYFSKNTLNIFRYKNGYREGTYIKQWGNQENDTTTKFHLFEDNVILHDIVTKELAHHNWLIPDTRTELYALLEKKYQRAVMGLIR